MKTVYLIGGTMGVGKTTVCRVLKRKLRDCVMLDGDWCWDSDPFKVSEETKAMVLDNITYLLNSFIKCSAYSNVVFCWVMHRREITDAILSSLKGRFAVKIVYLTASEQTLRERLSKDIQSGQRSEDVIERSVQRIPLYDVLPSVKINTDNKTPSEIAEEIIALKPCCRVSQDI